MPEYKVNIVIRERKGQWFAQCLQYDIGAEAGSLEDVMYELERSIVGHLAICDIHDLEPFESLDSAPEHYWDLWRSARNELKLERAPAFRGLHGPVVPPIEYSDVRLAATA